MRDARFKGISLVVLVVLAGLWLTPIYAMVNTSFKSQPEVADQRYLQLPHRLQFANYLQAFRALAIGLRNSAVITLPATFLCIFLGSLAGYFLTMFEFKQSQLVFFWIVVATFLPYQIVLIPITTLISRLGLLNTYGGLILIYVILNIPMGTLITATFFMKMPVDFQEAAALDGCKPFQFYRKILVPVSIPGLVSAAILVFVQIYNEFLLAIALTRGPAVKPVMPILAELKGSQIAQWHIQMAGAVIVALFPLLIFIVLSEYFVSGLMAGYGKE
jgi:glucose/mannose transport system permease protein